MHWSKRRRGQVAREVSRGWSPGLAVRGGQLSCADALNSWFPRRVCIVRCIPVMHIRCTQRQMATGATVLKESPDSVPDPAPTHARLCIAGRHSDARPAAIPRTPTPPPCQCSPPAYDCYPTSLSRTPTAHHAGPCCLENCVDTRHPCVSRAHTAHHPYSHHTRRRQTDRIQGPKTNLSGPCNKAEASAHGMGSGGLAVDAMAIGCLGVTL
jgi:hypothetical protein